MFAGRYVWWLVTTSALFLISLVGFDYVASVIVGISDCASNEGSCYTLNNWLMGVIKPVLVDVSGVALVLVVVIRILYLRFLPLWIVPVLAWAGAVAGTFRAYAPMWHGNADYVLLGQQMPPSTYAFLALALFLAFPLEDEDAPEQGGAAPIGLLAGFMAFMCTLHAFATASGLPMLIAKTFHAFDLSRTIATIREILATFLLVADGNPIPGYFVTILFALALALRVLRHERLVSGQL
ncbi:hypothetical protein [Gellertiella hungarica]|uniref:Uncharacterized protein n=1 Tax=Gellertiella hungarica TaxID=1572859 RepID=A0A7W6J483_9HYPH|nr:hypothetical protein [Gellertiella hungarica]MBB4064514.1 hypothetical protein [Gellertiella hungarica]